MNQKKPKKGDIFVTSWGYDQTNYDYIVVESISPTGKTALCKVVGVESTRYEAQHNVQVPAKKGVGKPFRLKILYNDKLSNGEVSLRGSYPFIYSQAGDENPSKRLGWFSIHNEGQEYWETDSMFGH